MCLCLSRCVFPHWFSNALTFRECLSKPLQNLFISSVAAIIFSFSNPHTTTLPFCFIICTKSGNIKIATASILQQSSETLITPGCSQQEIKCAVLDALAAIHGFNDISGFSRLWHEHQRWVVSRFLMACSRVRSGSCGTEGHPSVGGRRCQAASSLFALLACRQQKTGEGNWKPLSCWKAGSPGVFFSAEMSSRKHLVEKAYPWTWPLQDCQIPKYNIFFL